MPRPMNRTLHHYAVLLLLGVLIFRPAIAIAEPSISDRKTARALVIDGRAKLAAGDYEGARRAFKAAHDIMGVPTTGLDLAKALAALGLLLEARSAALDVTHMPQKPSEPEAFTDARAAAATFTEQLAARIPAVVISLKGIDAKTTPSVTVDGEALSLSMLMLPRPINPGAYTIVASAPGYATKQRSVTLKEGETVPVEITLARAVTVELTPSKLPPETPPEPTVTRSSAGQRIAGFAVGGAGLVSVAVGAAFGATAMSRNSASKVDGHCDAQSFCDATGKELRLGSYQAATISTVGFVIGGVALAGGAVLILTAPSQRSAASVAIGPGRVSVAGRW
jgi:hypothetical protein